MAKMTVRGFRRRHGRAGVRNDLWVIPTTACLNGTLRSLLESYHKQYWIDSVKLLEHSCGCSHLAGGGNLWTAERALTSLALHPNAAGVLVVGLGCEDFPLHSLIECAELAGAGSVVHKLAYAEAREEEVLTQLDKLGANAPRTREVFPLSHLCVGVVRRGGGCERVFQPSDLLERLCGWLTRNGASVLLAGVGESGGDDVLEYGERVARAASLEAVSSPTHLPGALTSLSVSGAQILICDSDAPASFGAPVPAIRVRLNANAENPCLDWIDFNPASFEESAKALADLLLAVAEGERTASERRSMGTCHLAIDSGGPWRYA